MWLRTGYEPKLFPSPPLSDKVISIMIIDLHTHGIAGYDTRDKDPENILAIAEIHGSYGVNAILPTLYPGSIPEMRAQMDAVRKAMEVQRKRRYDKGVRLKNKEKRGKEQGAGHDNNAGTAEILGVHLEGPFLNPSWAGTLDARYFLSPSEYNYNQLAEGFEDVIRIITLSPELEGATALTGSIADRGIAVNMGHSNATFAEAEACFHRGAHGITHLFNAMRSIHHREPGISGFGLLNNAVFVECIADPFHLHPKTLEMIFTIKDPSRIIIVSDSVRDTHLWGNAGARDSQIKPVTDVHDVLKGGATTVTEASDRLIADGFDEKLVTASISVNPESYLHRS